MRTIQVDGDLIRRRRLALGPDGSLRAAARNTHLTGTSLTRVETTGVLAADTTLGELERLAGYLGVPTADLLVDPAATPPAAGEGGNSDTARAATAAAPGPPGPTPDAATLGGLLAHGHRLVDRTVVATALGWTLDRLRTAQDTLDARLRPLGLRVHEVHSTIGLRPACTGQDTAADTLAATRTAATGMSTSQAALVHKALTGTLRLNTVRDGDRPGLAELVNLGILEHVHHGRDNAVRLTAAAARAFTPPSDWAPLTVAPGSRAAPREQAASR